MRLESSMGATAAVGLHDEHVVQLRVCLESPGQVGQVAAEHRADVGVDDGGAQAVEIP